MRTAGSSSCSGARCSGVSENGAEKRLAESQIKRTGHLKGWPVKLSTKCRFCTDCTAKGDYRPLSRSPHASPTCSVWVCLQSDRPPERVACLILNAFFRRQQSCAPAGTESSSIIRCSSSLPSFSQTAESSMPLESCPIILRGGRFRIATTVLPTSCSGS